MKKLTKRIGDILLEEGLINDDQLNEVLAKKRSNEKLGDALVRHKYLTESQVLKALEKQLGIKIRVIDDAYINSKLVGLIPEDYVRKNLVIPYEIRDNKLVIVVNDPLNYFIADDIRIMTGFNVIVEMATKTEIERVVSKQYGVDFSVDEIVPVKNSKNRNANEAERDSPLIKLVNQLLLSAIKQEASDIHFDPYEDYLRVRFRVDGTLISQKQFPKEIEKQLISRIKILGKMDITITRQPQDGRIKMRIDNIPVDIRISSLPTIHGEKLVLRLIKVDDSIKNWSDLGLTISDSKLIDKMISQPYGIVLVSGPTGAGKSVTLYSCLSKLNKEATNIITLEDPVEVQIEGLNQVQINPQVGLTFANGLRSILRQDPNIIMIGEIRDYETAEMAVRASLTGHLVLSTIHTNDSIGAVTRLKDMGVEPFLLASSMVGVIAQRLVRRVCPDCSTWISATEREKQLFNNYGLEITKVKRGKGCPSCNNLGYKGRVGIFEILNINDELRKMISSSESEIDIKQQAIYQGYKRLIENGFEKVIEGVTTTEEVLRVCQ